MKKKLLDRGTSGINHFLNLKKDLENDQNRLLMTLPLFVRIMFLDQPNPWVKEINRFDFIKLVCLSNEFEVSAISLSLELKYKSNLISQNKDYEEIEIESFLNKTILYIKNESYTIQEFILGVGYNGGLHMQPERDKAIKFELLYHSFMLLYPHIIISLFTQIAQLIIDVFEEFNSLLQGNNDGHSTNRNFQPIIVENGKMLEGMKFDKSYVQFPIRAKKNMGIRICIEIKLVIDSPETNFLLEYGHSLNRNISIQMLQASQFFVVKVGTQNVKKTIRINLNDYRNDEFREIELAVYPNGFIVLAIDRITKEVEDLSESISLIDGKVILGSDLRGDKFGIFFQKTITFQSIDRQNEMRFLGAYSLRKIDIRTQNIDSKIIKRAFV